ncbi:MAG: PorV/PorQ family protein [Elusimicrobia bacterium]|nr:PorV/PorQ family protein [Elusimicrobiota bacterium]
MNAIKNIKHTGAIIGFIMICLCLPNFILAGGAGSSSASFLKFSPSPRASAMGEAYVSIVDGAYASYWNPAGLAGIEVPGFAATYNKSFEDISHQYMAIVYPLKYGSTIGLNFTRLGMDSFQGYDSEGTETEQIESSDLAVGIAYGRTIFKDEIERPVFSAGTNFKYISEKLADVSANTFGVDLGAIYYFRPDKYWMKKIPAQELRVAATVKNIGPGLKFDKTPYPLPTGFSLGASWHSHPDGSNKLILSLDNTISNDEPYAVSFGAEFTMFQLLSFRAGYKTAQDIGSGIRAGFGFKLSFIDIDYSMASYGELGQMQKLGVSMKFGHSKAEQPLAGKISRVEKAKIIAPKKKIEELDLFAKDYLAVAKKNLEKRKYASAAKNIDRAFNLTPDLKKGEWGGRKKRLDAIVKGLKFDTIQGRENIFAENTEQSNVSHETIMAYIEGGDLKAFLLSHAAFGSNVRGDAVFEELLYLISDLVKIHVRRDEILPKTALITEKLKKSAKAFYIKEFDVAAKECEEVVLLDVSNRLGWTRLGSAYYMMGDIEKAKKAYLTVIKLYPNDEITKKFVEERGWNSNTEDAKK